MDETLQAMNIQYTKNAHGYSAHVTAEQYDALWRLPGVVIVEAQRAAVSCFMRRVTWGIFARWQVVEQEAKAVA